MDYVASLEYLKQLELHGIKLGLDQVSELLDSVGNPQDRLRCIHVAGTNGKGSVCALLYSALNGAGFRTAFYSSPHLVSIRERFRIAGRGISEDEFALAADILRPCTEKMKSAGRCPTFFEFTTAMAFHFFASENADFVVLETGMGGRFDATNVVTPILSAISSIGIDHAEYLGNSESSIAFEKAGIIKNAVPSYCSIVSRTAEDAIRAVALEKRSPMKLLREFLPENELAEIDKSDDEDLRLPDRTWVRKPLRGIFQNRNILFSAMILEDLAKQFGFSYDSALRGLEKTKWPGRLQTLPDGSLLDGSHNPQAASILADSLKVLRPDEKFSVIYGSLADKDSASVIKILSEIASEFVFIPACGGRKYSDPQELRKTAQGIVPPDLRLDCASCLKDALKKKTFPATLICGSLYIVGEALRLHFSEERIINI